MAPGASEGHLKTPIEDQCAAQNPVLEQCLHERAESGEDSHNYKSILAPLAEEDDGLEKE